MTTFLMYCFYLAAGIFIIYELMKMGGLDLRKTLKELEAKAKEEEEANKLVASNADKSIANQATFALVALFALVFVVFYTMWTIAGLFTSQWVIFAVLIGLGLVVGIFTQAFKDTPFARGLLRVDAFITIIILVFLILNKFHLHWV